MPLGPREHGRTAYSGEAVRRVGAVHTYACPGDATPVALDSGIILGHYTGEYRCSGPGQAQNGDGRTNRNFEVRQNPSDAIPNDAWRNRVPSGQTQETEHASRESSADQTSVENAADNQDNEEGQDAETNQDGTDQYAALLRQNQQTLQNMRNMARNIPRNQASPIKSGGRVQTGQCSGERCY